MVKNVILILGMHRSGTSAIARVMNLCGASLPKTLLGQNDGNLRGHWESQAIIDAHNTLLSTLGSQWSDWRPLELDARKSTRARAVGDMADVISVEYKGADTVVIKEPRICRFAPAYLDAVQSLGAAVHVIIPMRNPLEVAASLSKRDGLSLQHGLFLWLSHMIGAEQGSREQSRAFVNYPSFLASPVTETARITADMPFALPFSVEQAGAQIEDYVEPTLKREAARAEDVAEHPLCAGWINDVYQALLVLTQSPNAPEASAIIDRVATEFNGASDMLWAVQTESELKSKAYEQALADRGAALSAMNVDHQTAWAAAQADREGEMAAFKEKFETRIAALNATLADRDSRIKDIDALIAQKLSELSVVSDRVLALDATLADRDSHIKTLEAVIAQKTTQLSEENERVLALNVALDDRDSHIKTLEAVIAQKTTRLSEENERVLALNATLDDRDSHIKALEAVIAQKTSQLSEENERVLALSRANETGQAREAQLKTTLEALKSDITTQISKREALEATICAQKQQHNDAIVLLRADFSAQKDDLETHIARLKQQIAASKQTVATLISERNFMQDEFRALLSSVEMNLETAYHELWQARADKGAVEQSLNDVLSSTSWRFTRGFRGVMNRLRGRGAVKAILAPLPVARITHDDRRDT